MCVVIQLQSTPFIRLDKVNRQFSEYCPIDETNIIFPFNQRKLKFLFDFFFMEFLLCTYIFPMKNNVL